MASLAGLSLIFYREKLYHGRGLSRLLPIFYREKPSHGKFIQIIADFLPRAASLTVSSAKFHRLFTQKSSHSWFRSISFDFFLMKQKAPLSYNNCSRLECAIDCRTFLAGRFIETMQFVSRNKWLIIPC